MSAGDWAWLIGGTAAAGTVTYFTCVRPMRRDKGHCETGMAAGQTSSSHDVSSEPDTAQEIARLREERATLLAAQAPDEAKADQNAES